MGERLRMVVEWSGRGADAGRDLTSEWPNQSSPGSMATSPVRAIPTVIAPSPIFIVVLNCCTWVVEYAFDAIAQDEFAAHVLKN
jgi:hypothetical protein